jgi:hypothetical protein
MLEEVGRLCVQMDWVYAECARHRVRLGSAAPRAPQPPGSSRPG